MFQLCHGGPGSVLFLPLRLGCLVIVVRILSTQMGYTGQHRLCPRLESHCSGPLSKLLGEEGFVYSSTYLSTYPPIHPSIHPSIHCFKNVQCEHREPGRLLSVELCNSCMVPTMEIRATLQVEGWALWYIPLQM